MTEYKLNSDSKESNCSRIPKGTTSFDASCVKFLTSLKVISNASKTLVKIYICNCGNLTDISELLQCAKLEDITISLCT